MPPPLHDGRRRRDATAGAPPVGVWRGYSCTSSMNATKAPAGEPPVVGAAAGPGGLVDHPAALRFARDETAASTVSPWSHALYKDDRHPQRFVRARITTAPSASRGAA